MRKIITINRFDLVIIIPKIRTNEWEDSLSNMNNAKSFYTIWVWSGVLVYCHLCEETLTIYYKSQHDVCLLWVESFMCFNQKCGFFRLRRGHTFINNVINFGLRGQKERNFGVLYSIASCNYKIWKKYFILDGLELENRAFITQSGIQSPNRISYHAAFFMHHSQANSTNLKVLSLEKRN